MNEQKKILSSIFEPALSLDNKKPGSSRSLHLFERMAERLDEIAANTRGLVKGIIAHVSFRSHGDTSDTQKEQKKAQNPIQATVKAKRPTRITNEKVKSAVAQKPILASVNTVPDKEQATLAHRAQLSDISSYSVRTVKKEEDDIKATTSNASAISKPKSAIANNEAKEKRNAEENGNRIAEAVLSGMDKFGNLLKSGTDAVSQNNDIKDATGYALGGPFYGALKEIQEALPNISSEKPDDEKERKADSRKLLKAINDPAGRQRDDKGRFIKPDQNEARRQIAQTEVAEAQLALDEKEAKKEEKRHKELLRAVKANKRGMLDRFLDRRMGLGRPGRDRIIRERTVREKGKPGAKSVQAKGPKPDSRLLPNNGSNGRLSRETDIGSRARRKGILSRAGGAAQSAGNAVTGTLAMGGKALGGMLRMLPGIGQALALGMAAYEGFQGWNDKELHQQAFGLKDGQEATTGQKASSAAASILDMGGLTSGLLGMFGIEFDKAGVARSIYELGSNIGQLASDFMANAGPILSSVWSGISDIGTKAWEGAKNIGNAVADIAVGLWDKGSGLVSSIWEGAKNIGGAVAEVAGSIWDKGASLVSGIWDGAQNIAGSIATFAGNALEKGAGMLSSLWEGYTGAVGKIWGGLTDFAQSAVAKGGEILSGLWSKATELPGKIIDGAADLAKGALETGGKLLSDGWNAVRNWGKGLLSSDEAEAKPVSQAEIKQTSTENAESPQTVNKAIAQEVSVKPEQVTAPVIETQTTPIINPALDSKLSSINTEENAKKSATSSESVSSALALEQMKQNDIENKNRNEIINNLELANKTIKNVSKLLEEEFRKDDLPDEFGIAGALQNVSSAIQGVRSGGSSYSYGNPASGAGGGGGGNSSFAYNPDSKLGDTIARFESGNEGVHKIGYDRQGGTSYGKWQLSSRQGSYEEWLKLLESKGGQHAEIARQLRAAGPTNTGSRSGHHVGVYKKLAAENAQLFEETQRESLMKHNYNIAMKGIKSDSLRRMIEEDKSLQEMMFSTSVQHGGGGARSIFNGVYQEGMSREQLINAVYSKRAGQFGSSPELSKGLNNRFREERDLILGMKKGEQNARAIRARLAGGGSEAVNAGMSAMVAAATQTAIDNDVKYTMGAKNSAAGQIDCSGWVSEMGQRTMAEMNNAMGAEVFSKDARRAFKRGAANEGAAGIIRAVSNWNGGQLLTNDQLTPDQAREGMVIGLAKAGDSRVSDRFKGIGHIVQTYRDPQTGELMVSESRGGKGVMNSRYSDWYAQYQKKGYKMYGSDLSAMADASKIAPTAPKALADNQTNISPETIRPSTDSQSIANNAVPQVAEAQVALSRKEESRNPQLATPFEPVSQPVSLAQANNAAPVGVPTRKPLEVPAIREIDPAREVKTSSNDNGPILKILGEILAAIQAGNKKMGNSGTNDGPPSISTEYDDPAAQGLAADTA